MDKRDCIIIDLEGTLSNCAHRIHHWINRDYDEWNRLFVLDTVNRTIVAVIKKSIQLNQDVILCTAKSVEYQQEVSNWLLEQNLLQFINCTYYRDIGDSRSSVEVKKDMLTKIRKKWDVYKAYDDRADICQMYRVQGIIAVLFGAKEMTPTEEITLKTPADRLKEAAEVFKDKDDEYGSSYKEFGKIMLAYFPNGVVLKTEEDFTRWGILNMLMAKTNRYCNNFTKGGHPDSLVDLPIYSAMLAEIDQLGRS